MRSTCFTSVNPRASLTLGLLSLLLAPAATAQECGNSMVAGIVLELLPDGAPAVTAVQSGMWSDVATWGGTLPGPGDDVRIPDGIAVTYDIDDDGDQVGADTTRFHIIRVDGALTWATDRDTTLYVDTLVSAPTGMITIGDETAPIPAARTAEIIIIADTPLADPRQLGRGFVPHGPHRIVGADTTDFIALTADALAGATTLTLVAPPAGWAVGDTLVLGGTFYDPTGSDVDNSRFHDEVLTITALAGNVVSFVNTAPGFTGLRWDHVRPDGTHFDPDDLTLYVANLTRNVTFRSELDPSSPDAPGGGDIRDLRRGHAMVMHTPDSVVMHTAFVDFGRLNKNVFIDDPLGNVDGTPGSGANVRGRYAFHHHRNLPQGNVPVDFDSCAPARVIGCVVWGSPGWGFVHHDSYSVFEDNVAFDVLGAAFVQEAGNEIGRWQNNLSIKTTGDDDPDLTVEPFGDGYKRVTNFDFGFNGEAYWIQGASQVEFIDNIAISAAGGGADIFSDVDGNSNRDRGVVPVEHLPADIQHIVTNGNGTIAGNRVPANTFRGFEVYNSDFGLLTWNHMRNQGNWIGFTCPCDGNFHREYAVIEDFTFWNIYGQGVHLQYSSQIEFLNGLIASSDLATPGVDDKPPVDLSINGDGRGYGFGMNGPTKRLHLDTVIIEGWEFGIRTPDEGQINTLDIGKNTGSEGAAGLPARRSVYRNLLMADNGDHFYRRQNGFSLTQDFSNHLVIDGGSFADDVPNEPPTADFTFESLGPFGVVRLSGLAAFDTDTPNGPTPVEPGVGFITNYSVARNDPNYIVGYGWDLDGDGQIDAFGETLTHTFPVGQATPVTLTVWDHQGATHTTTLEVTPAAQPYGELIVDGDLDISGFNNGSIHSGTTDAGWFADRATLTGGYVHLDGQYNFAWIGQALYDARVRRGEQRLSFAYALSEGHSDPSNGQISRLRVRVWGIDSEFDAVYREYPAPAGAIPYSAATLYDEWFETPTAWQTVERTIDFGAGGYEYVMISLQGTGVSNTLPDDFALVDSVSIVGAGAPCPGDVDGDGVVDFADLLDVLVCWGPVQPPCASSDVATTGASNGVIDFTDILAIIAAWGPCD